jgi:phenylacetate-CoA ligase
LERIHAYDRRVKQGPQPWNRGELPEWVGPFVERCRTHVPFYRNRKTSADFFSLPVVRRDEFRNQPWALVADDLPLENLIVYTTSGTGGTILKYPATPELPSRYLPLVCHALAQQGIHLDGGARVSIMHVCDQNPTVVLYSLSSYLNGAGTVKVNLHPSDWNKEEDAVHFINDCNPELFTGDPVALEHLARLPVSSHPRAIVSSAMSLTSALKELLESRFGCPVFDIYSMNESGPIGFSSRNGEYEILQPDLFVEVLNTGGQPSPPNETGELTLTGGLNPYLPLLRYGTGDFGILDHRQGQVPRLRQLHGRKVVQFEGANGNVFNSIDVASALNHIPLAALSLHQRADRSLALVIPAEADTFAVEIAIRKLFGASAALEITQREDMLHSGKPIQFTSHLEDEGDAHPSGP